MAVVKEQSTNVAADSGASAQFTAPLLQGQLVIVLCVRRADGPMPTASAEWTLLDSWYVFENTKSPAAVFARILDADVVASPGPVWKIGAFANTDALIGVVYSGASITPADRDFAGPAIIGDGTITRTVDVPAGGLSLMFAHRRDAGANTMQPAGSSSLVQWGLTAIDLHADANWPHIAVDRPDTGAAIDNQVAVTSVGVDRWLASVAYAFGPSDGEEEPPPDVADAWDVYAADALTGTKIATLENAKGRWIRSELQGTGEGGFVINRHATEATEAILAEGNLVKVRIADCSDDYIDGFFLGPDGDYVLLSAQGGKGKEDLTFRGPGALSYLDRARMTRCAFSIDPTEVGTWTKVWVAKAIAQPSGVAFDADEPGYVYVLGLASRRVKKLDQSSLAVVSTSPALWSGSSRFAGGLSFDPDDDTIAWVLEAPWLSGSTATTKIHKVRRSDWHILHTYDLGAATQLTDIRVDGDYVWTSRYDNDHIQQRSKADPSTIVDSFTITYKGKLQRKPNGIAINGTTIAYWFGGDLGGGTGRALLADTSDPDTITGVLNTKDVSAFGGDWTTEDGDDFLYAVSFTQGKTWKYQLTVSEPACADDSGVFHPEQTAPGALAWRVLQEITHPDRPVQPCAELGYDFTEDADSNGTPWPPRTSTEEFTWRVGDHAWSDVLARLIPAGVTFDLDVHTMTLHAYVDADFGTDRTADDFGEGKVRFVEGVNLGVNGDLGRRDNRGQPDTHITVLGDGGVYGAADLAGRYVREGFMQVAGPSTEAVLDAIGDDELARQRLVADALGFETLWGRGPGGDETSWAAAALEGRYIPKRHYWKGDLVRVDMAPGEFAYSEEDLRVYGTLISERDGGWRSAIDLGSAYKIPEAITQVGGTSGLDSSSESSGGGSSGGTPVITQIPLTVTDPDAGVSIPRVTEIRADGITSPEPGVAVIPRGGDLDVPPIEELDTSETDTRRRLAPDGVGGATFVFDPPAYPMPFLPGEDGQDGADGIPGRDGASSSSTPSTGDAGSRVYAHVTFR